MKFRRDVTEYEIKDWLKEYGEPKSGFGMRDESAEHHWREIGDDFSLLGKKSIIVFPGNGSNSAEAANGMCKFVAETIPPEQKDQWQIYAMHYEKGSCDDVPTVIRVADFMDKHLVPLIASKDEEGDLHRFDAQTAAKNLRNVVIDTHCYGGSVAEKMGEQLHELMLDIGYTDKESDYILKQLVIVQHNNIDEDLGSHPSKCTQLIRISQNDSLLQTGKYGSLGYSLAKGSLGEDNFAYIKLSENERILLTRALIIDEFSYLEHNRGYWWSDKHKTPEGQKENQMFSLMFGEILSSDYPIENMEQILKNAVEKNPQYKELSSTCLHAGLAFDEECRRCHDDATIEFEKLTRKKNNNTLTFVDIWRSNPHVCLMSDDQNPLLITTFMEEKDYQMATAFMKKVIPFIEKEDRVYNKKEIEKSLPRWVESAIADKQVDFIKEIPMKYLIEADISKADDKMLSVIAESFTKEQPNMYNVDEYAAKIAEIYVLSEKMHQSKHTKNTRQILENAMFAPNSVLTNYNFELIADNAQKKGGATKLVDLLVSKGKIKPDLRVVLENNAHKKKKPQFKEFLNKLSGSFVSRC